MTGALLCYLFVISTPRAVPQGGQVTGFSARALSWVIARKVREGVLLSGAANQRTLLSEAFFKLSQCLLGTCLASPKR